MPDVVAYENLQPFWEGILMRSNRRAFLKAGTVLGARRTSRCLSAWSHAVGPRSRIADIASKGFDDYVWTEVPNLRSAPWADCNQPRTRYCHFKRRSNGGDCADGYSD